MALHYPDRVLGLILIGTAPTLPVNEAILNGIRSEPEETAALITKWAWAKDTDEQVKRLGYRRLLQTDPAVTYGDYVACNAFDVRDRLERINVPTLVVGGTADKMTPFTYSEALAAGIPNATLVRIDNGGHMMALEKPTTVADAVQTWLMEL